MHRPGPYRASEVAPCEVRELLEPGERILFVTRSRRPERLVALTDERWLILRAGRLVQSHGLTMLGEVLLADGCEETRPVER
jgi:hypothetical protein